MTESNRTKNMKLATWDGNIWYPQVYDADTSCGLDNSGFLKFDSDVEIGDKNVFNTTSSKLWQKVMLLLMDDIKAEYAKLRNTTLTLNNIIKYIVEDQIEMIPASFYNNDMQTKYLNFGTTYLYALHGNSKNQLIKFITDRLLYIDTLYDYTVTTTDFVTIRSSKLGLVYLDIQTFIPMYLRVKWRNEADGSGIQKLRVSKGQTVRFSFEQPTETDQEIMIYGGKYLKSIGDLSNLAPTTISIGNAPKLTDLTCHSENLINTDLANCVNLTHVDLSGCTNLGTGVGSNPVLDISKCMNLQYIDIRNTTLRSVQLDPRGSNIEEIWYPTTVESIVIQNCPALTTVGLTLGHNCKELKLINCPNVSIFGNRKLIKSNNSYALHNGAFLSRINNITLNASCLDMEDLVVQYPIDLKTITVSNMPNLKSIKLGVNKTNENAKDITITADYVSMINEAVSIKIKATSCSNLKDFYLTGRGKYGSIHNLRCNYAYKDNYYLGVIEGWCYEPDYIRMFLGYTGGDSRNLSCFVSNILDLSETNIENINVYISSYINGLKIPITTKNIEINRWKLCKEIDDYYSENSSYNSKIIERNYYEGPYWDTPVGGFFGYPQGLTMPYGSCYFEGNAEYINICNIYNKDDFDPSITDPVWDFENINLENMLLANMRYSLKNNGYFSSISALKSNIPLPTLRNLNIKPINYTPNLYFFKSIENCILDLREFIGESLRYALYNFDDSINNNVLLINSEYDTVLTLVNMIQGCKTQQLKWNDNIVETYLNQINDYKQASGINLLEQTDYETEGIYINNNTTSFNCSSNEGCQLFHNSNLKYIKELNLPKITQVQFLFGYSYGTPTSMVERIGKLNTPLCTSFNYIFNNNKNIKQIDEWYMSDNEVGADSIFANSSIKIIKLIGTINNFGNAFMGCTLENLDISELNFNNCSLLYSFSGTTYPEGIIKINGSLSTLNFAFKYSNIKNIDLSNCDLSNCTGMNSTFDSANVEIINMSNCILNNCKTMSNAFAGATIGEIIGLEYIPDSVTSCERIYQNMTLSKGNIPIFTRNSLCTNIRYMFYNYKGSIPSEFIMPSGATSISMVFSKASIPSDFILDMSNVNYILSDGNPETMSNTTINNLTIKFPKYVYQGNYGVENGNFIWFLRHVAGLKTLIFDFSSFLGSEINFKEFFCYTYVDGGLDNEDGLIIKGLDFNIIDESTWCIQTKLAIKEFSISKPCNSKNIYISSFRMSFENYSKFINEALDTLDCASLLFNNIFENKVTIFNNPKPDEEVSFTISVSAEVSKYFNENKNTTGTDYGLYFLFSNSDGTEFKGGGFGIFAPSTGEAYQKTFNFKRGTSGNRYISHSVKISLNKINNITDDILNEWIKLEYIKISYTNAQDTPKTLTLSSYCNYDQNISLSSDQKNQLISQASLKGWNVAFV